MTNQAALHAHAEALKNCAKEAIHQIPLIQPHGFLLAFDANDGEIIFASDNVQEELNTSLENILNSNIFEFIENSSNAIPDLLSKVNEGSPQTFKLTFCSSKPYQVAHEVLAHRSDGLIVLECMPFSNTEDVRNVYIEIENLIQRQSVLQRIPTLQEYLERCADEVRNITGYQRVLIYKFHPDWTGEVVAESAGTNLKERFIGHRFPASDIPVQARELYRKNRLRIIGDVNATPIAIRSRYSSAILDQSHCLLRSPSTMHLGYLRNMGVAATLTISLIKDEELWGMVACHHDEPKVPPDNLRRVTKLFCRHIADAAVQRVESLLIQEEALRKHFLNSEIKKLMASLSEDLDLLRNSKLLFDNLSTILNFSQFGLSVDGEWVVKPDIPDAYLVNISNIVPQLKVGDSYYSHKLTDISEKLKSDLHDYGGIAIVTLGSLPGSYFVLLRKALDKAIQWAGAPSNNLTTLPNGLPVLGPRSSFETWTEVVKDQSEPWSVLDRSLCRRFAQMLSDSVSVRKDRIQREQLNLLASCMARLNDMVLVTGAAKSSELKIIYANDAFLNHSGYTSEDIVNRSLHFLKGVKTDPISSERIVTALRERVPINIEIVYYRKSEEPCWVDLNLTPVFDENSKKSYWVWVLRDIEERKRVEFDIEQLVYFDTLTGLPNRRLLLDRLESAIGNAVRHGRHGALVFIDLDNFKDLNDTAGHIIGDELLIEVAKRLKREIRNEDTVARLGGDEFVVVLEGLNAIPDEAASEAGHIAEKLIAIFEEEYCLSNVHHHSSASLGLSIFGVSYSKQTVEELLKQSDFAMYQAKAAGKGTYRFFDASTQALLLRRNALEANLMRAFSTNNLQIYYQPIFKADKSLHGVEALLRWHEVYCGWISPAEFIPMAERNGLIIPIGKWVLQQVCENLVSWSVCNIKKSWSIAVNVSAKQIENTNFVSDIVQILELTQCNPELLKLEITESMLQDDVDLTIFKMETLRKLGIKFSVDDFGTGYSSLSYLRRLPIDVVKIDRSFVNRIGHDRTDQAICQTILNLGHNLNLDIVAEGVETDSQFNYLVERGCNYFQGFLFSKAIPLIELESQFG